MTRLTCTLLAFGVTLAWVSGARADAMPKFNTGWYAPLGVNAGWAMHPERDDGLLLGLEASFVHFDRGWTWVGLYADGLRDFADESFHLGVGPEIGIGPLGLDAGYTAQVFEAQTLHGFSVRPMFTLGVIGLYGRVTRILGEFAETQGSVGLLFKYPIEVATEPVRQYRPVPRPPGPTSYPPPGPPPPYQPGPYAPPPGR